MKKMLKTKEQIIKELETESRKLRAAGTQTAARATAPSAPPIMETAKKMATKPAPPTIEQAKKIYAGTPKESQVITSGSGGASYVLVDYSCDSDYRVLWAYAADAWRYKYLSDAEVAGIAKVIMEAKWLDVWWDDNNLIYYLRCWKQF